MGMNWRHRRRGPGLEAALRKHRPQPRDEFVRALSAEVEGARRGYGPRPVWSRLAFAGAISALLVGVTLSFGALSYAKSGAASTYEAVKQAVVKHEVSVSVHSSARDQYPPPPPHPSNPSGSQTQPPQSNVAGAQVAIAATGTSGTLPFTGLSLVSSFAVALVLMAVGIVLRRKGRRQN